MCLNFRLKSVYGFERLFFVFIHKKHGIKNHHFSWSDLILVNITLFKWMLNQIKMKISLSFFCSTKSFLKAEQNLQFLLVNKHDFIRFINKISFVSSTRFHPFHQQDFIRFINTISLVPQIRFHWFHKYDFTGSINKISLVSSTRFHWFHQQIVNFQPWGFM